MTVSSNVCEALVQKTNSGVAYGDMNLFCSCGPVEAIDGITGSAAPSPT